MKIGSNSNGTNFYKWVLWRIIKNLLYGSHFVIRVDVIGSQLLLRSSRSIYLMNRTVRNGSDSNGTNPVENYKNLLHGSNFVIRELVSMSELLLHCSGPIYLMNRTVKYESHSNGTSFYKWVIWKIIIT